MILVLPWVLNLNLSVCGHGLQRIMQIIKVFKPTYGNRTKSMVYS